jgi:hypothetical protein
MTPVLTLYILGGCVAAAGLVFIVMIVVMALRRPQLPNLTQDPMPLQRMIRALTPLPLAPVAGLIDDEAPTTLHRPAVPSRPPPVPVRPVVHVAPALPPLPRSAPSPFVWPNPVGPVIPNTPVTQRTVSRPQFPRYRRRWGLRIFVATFMLGLGSTAAVVAHPAMLDPLCDDYEWFGAETTAVLRDHAVNAHDTIADFIREL